MSRPRLLLVNPKRKHRYHWDLKELCRIMRKKTAVHPLALPTLAALTPDHYDIRIIDEEMGPVSFEYLPDIVGITGLGMNINRAYLIADGFRERGVPVVMGGAQVSFNVEETLRHADSVVIGEAEGVWAECLADFEGGGLRSTYKREAPCDFRTSPRPRWDLVDTRKVMALGVQASRGCTYACEFCLVRHLFGRRQRYREIDDLVEEIRGLPKRQITFVDDNLATNKAWARELMERLAPLGVSWMCQCSLDVCEDEKLLAAMARAGCTAMLLGIESLNAESLRETGKHQNRVERYEEGIRRVHRQGINVIGSFIVGFDTDRLEAFDQILDFTERNCLSLIMLNVLTAYPGTSLYERLKGEGRISEVDREMLNGIFPTIRFRHISQAGMYQKYFETLEKMFDHETLRRHSVKVFGNGDFRHYNDKDVGLRDRLASLSHLLGEYVLTGNAAKRRLFADLFGLVFKGKVGAGNVVEFLLLISSFNGYLDFTREHRDEILARIREKDPGPLECLQ